MSRVGPTAAASLASTWGVVHMSKRELIDRIMELNRSARREFLLEFNENELDDYLRQLESVMTRVERRVAVASNN